MYAIDGRLDVPMSLEAAWSEINAEPVVLVYAKDLAAHWPTDAPALIEYAAPSATRNYRPKPGNPSP